MHDVGHMPALAVLRSELQPYQPLTFSRQITRFMIPDGAVSSTQPSAAIEAAPLGGVDEGEGKVVLNLTRSCYVCKAR